MNIKNFEKILIKTLTERMTQHLIELADASIEVGVDEYIEKGYITLDFKGEFDSSNDRAEANKWRIDLCKKGLGFVAYRTISDISWSNMVRYLEKNGWQYEVQEFEGNIFMHIVRMPSRFFEDYETKNAE